MSTMSPIDVDNQRMNQIDHMMSPFNKRKLKERSTTTAGTATKTEDKDESYKTGSLIKP
jgi:hypothetical protein